MFYSFCTHVIVERCPEENTDYHAIHPDFPVGTAEVTESWEICGKKCANETSCTHWTWINQNHSTASYRGKCLFKPEKGDIRSREWAISGSKECPETIGRNNIENKQHRICNSTKITKKNLII